jgi:ABC-2 type transport system permease protein
VAYRADTIINMLLSLMWLGWELLSLNIIFNNTATLGGWGPGELITLLGVFRLVNTLMQTVLWPSTEYFNRGVRDGSLDYTFLQPVSSQFLVSFSRMQLWRGWDLLLALILIVTGVGMSGSVTTPVNLLAFLALTTSGSMVIYSLWVVLITLTFYFTKFDNNVTILDALMGAARYPATVYPVWLRALITFVIPVALATTVPLQALRGELAWWQVPAFFAVGLVSLWVASRVWRAGTRRYSGASS